MQWTRRRWTGVIIGAVLVAGIGGTVAFRVVKANGGPPRTPSVVALEFTPADLVRVETRPLTRWLPVSGTLQPIHQATVKAKVSGDVREITVREGDAVRSGQVLARIDTADLESRLVERIGALESARAQLALADKTRVTNTTLLKQGFISQTAFDNSDSSYNVAQGSVKSAQA